MSSHARLLALTLAFAPAAYADDIYRSVMPNGDILYGESPYPGARSTKKVAAPPSGVTVVTPGDRTRAAEIRTQQGGASVIPTQPRQSPQPATAGSGATYGQGPGPLPKGPSY
jgi:hypothetical protein